MVVGKTRLLMKTMHFDAGDVPHFRLSSPGTCGRSPITPLDQLLAPLRTGLVRAREAKRLSDRTEAPAFNVFHFLRPDENLLSDMLADLCDPNGTHGLGDVFLRLFLTYAGVDAGSAALDRARVRREDVTLYLAANRRIDFTLEVGALVIGVENKPWAGDQPDQVPDYMNHLTKKHGAAAARLVYLSGTGDPPGSLPEKTAGTWMRDGRLRVLGYSPGLAGWLRACHEACQSGRVRAFLTDFIRYVETHFGGGAMSPRAETEPFVRFALASLDNLGVAAGFLSARDEILRAVHDPLIRELAARTTASLNAVGKGWRVLHAADDPNLRAAAEWVVVTKAGWPGGPDPKSSLRVALCSEADGPSNLYFQLRQDVEPESGLGARRGRLADRVAEAASEACGRGSRSATWWPKWWQYVDRYADWSDPAMLPELVNRQDEVLDYFAGRFARLAQAVDGALVSGAKQG
jgi:hypothetical protein